ncbi:MAG: 3'-5' exonuclease [Anaerolineales bacterium]|jgi:DNA polymerase-3 subunit epsilon
MGISRSDQARQEASLEAARIVKLDPIYLDTETTGLENWDEVIEIGLVDFSGQVLLETLIKPQGSIPPDATRIHGIRDRDVLTAPTWRLIWPQVQRIIEGRHLAIYNADYDLRMMRQSHARAGLEWRPGVFDNSCIMKLYAKYRGDWNPARRSFRWHSLEVAGRQCGLELSNTHRAADDALLARAVLMHMAEHA